MLYIYTSLHARRSGGALAYKIEGVRAQSNWRNAEKIEFGKGVQKGSRKEHQREMRDVLSRKDVPFSESWSVLREVPRFRKGVPFFLGKMLRFNFFVGKGFRFFL